MRGKIASLCAVLLLAACQSTPTTDKSQDRTSASSRPRPTTLDMHYADPFQTLVGDRVFFAIGKATLSPTGRQTLRRQAEYLKQHPQFAATIEGHCDSRGTRAYNQLLGQRRADAAKKYLVQLGVRAERLKTASVGMTKPFVLGQNEQAYAQNRAAVTILDF